MYHISSEQVDLLVTPQHRMYVQKYDTQKTKRKEEPYKIYQPEDIINKRVKYKKNANWKGKSENYFYLPSVKNNLKTYKGRTFDAYYFAKFLGYFVSEGHCNKLDTAINLYQNRGEVLDDMRLTLNNLGLKYHEVFSGNGISLRFKCFSLYSWLKEHVGTKSLNKRIPKLVYSWDKNLINVFIDAAVAGDGNIHKNNGHRVYYTGSKKLADDMQALALHAGIAANIRKDTRTGEHMIYTGQMIPYSGESYIVSFLMKTRLCPLVNSHLKNSKSRYLKENGYHDHYIDYDDKVYCVKVKHGLLYVRRNGKPCWSGNTHEAVRHRVGASYSQTSGRYVRLDEIKLVQRPELDGCEDILEEYMNYVKDVVKRLEERTGLRGKDKLPFDKKKKITSAIRSVAPNGIANELGWGVNIRSLRHVIELRTSRHADWEIRYIFNQVADIITAKFPHMLYGAEVEEVDGLKEYRNLKV